jgi:hypothetical protein
MARRADQLNSANSCLVLCLHNEAQTWMVVGVIEVFEIHSGSIGR